MPPLTISPLQYPTVPLLTISPLLLHLCNTRRIIRLIRTMKMTVHKTSNLICIDRHSGHQNKVEFLYFPYFLLIKNFRWGISFNLIYLQKCNYVSRVSLNLNAWSRYPMWATWNFRINVDNDLLINVMVTLQDIWEEFN